MPMASPRPISLSKFEARKPKSETSTNFEKGNVPNTAAPKFEARNPKSETNLKSEALMFETGAARKGESEMFRL